MNHGFLSIMKFQHNFDLDRLIQSYILQFKRYIKNYYYNFASCNIKYVNGDNN